MKQKFDVVGGRRRNDLKLVVDDGPRLTKTLPWAAADFKQDFNSIIYGYIYHNSGFILKIGI